MYMILIHSVMRWLILIVLLWAVFTGWEGRTFKRPFRVSDRIAVSAASVLSHVQLLLGFWLYMESPVVKGFWNERSFHWNDSLFFALVHFGLMTTAIVLITIGSALAKRDMEDRKKFSTVFRYYGIALLIILLAIPWPFSPLAQRPLLRF
ncbi:MAG TPA: hypothetical protein PLO67_10430 [Saprospiraceae bacterium]|nr:hypothetical protein [Saprospiraceae bacterium]